MLALPVTSQHSALQPDRLPAGPLDGLYIHVPFCRHKCHYCDFYSIVGQTEDRMARFVDLVLLEADFWRRHRTVRPATVFIGGGTPTLLPLGDMRRLLQGLRRRFDLANVAEWTVEANPATVDDDYCRMLLDCGVGRLSLGAQSFRPGELATLQRNHQPGDIARSLDIARRAGFSRLNIDLIFAIPGQRLNQWSENLRRALELGTEHLSCYALTYEPNTPLAVKRRRGAIQPVEESLELEMLRHTRHVLAAAGLPAYEISNFAQPGRECLHNLMYWSGGSYLGLGPSAASHIHGWRWRNRPHLGDWESALVEGRLPAIDLEHLTPAQRAGELAMLMLRTARGIVLDDYLSRTGIDPRKAYQTLLRQLVAAGLITAGPTALTLTEAGVALADGVAGEFLANSAGPDPCRDSAFLA